MNSITRKSFLKSLFGTAAVAVSAPAVANAVSSDLPQLIRDDLAYVLDNNGIRTPLFSGKQMRQGLVSVLQRYAQLSDIEHAISVLRDGELRLESYKIFDGDPNALRIDDIPMTEDWFRLFCAQNNIHNS